jgi:hypothetical protein
MPTDADPWPQDTRKLFLVSPTTRDVMFGEGPLGMTLYTDPRDGKHHVEYVTAGGQAEAQGAEDQDLIISIAGTTVGKSPPYGSMSHANVLALLKAVTRPLKITVSRKAPPKPPPPAARRTMAKQQEELDNRQAVLLAQQQEQEQQQKMQQGRQQHRSITSTPSHWGGDKHDVRRLSNTKDADVINALQKCCSTDKLHDLGVGRDVHDKHLAGGKWAHTMD